MAGVGKTTVGQALAARLGLTFVDTDECITAREGRSLREIIDAQGLNVFRAIECEAVCSLEPQQAVIATGGSVVYGHAAMEHLRGIATIIWLRNEPENIIPFIGDRSKRGLASEPNKSLHEIIAERTPLYAKYADITIDCGTREAEALAEVIAQQLRL